MSIELQERFKRAREKAKLSQVQLAGLVGCTPSQISLIESGKRNPSVALLGRVAAALDIQINRLIG